MRRPRDLHETDETWRGPGHVFRRVNDTQVRRFSEMYDFVTEGQFLRDDGVPAEWRQEWRASRSDHRWAVAEGAPGQAEDIVR